MKREHRHTEPRDKPLRTVHDSQLPTVLRLRDARGWYDVMLEDAYAHTTYLAPTH